MTVAELIDALRALPPDALVVMCWPSEMDGDPQVDIVEAPTPLSVVRRTIETGKFAGQFTLHFPQRGQAGEVAYDISGMYPR